MGKMLKYSCMTPSLLLIVVDQTQENQLLLIKEKQDEICVWTDSDYIFQSSGKLKPDPNIHFCLVSFEAANSMR